METEVTARPGQFVVEFLVKRTVLVEAIDEIQAEHEAAKKLKPTDKASAEKVRIVAGRYEDGTAYQPRDEWDSPMHKDD
jgi:hypothetical protein